MAEQLDPDAVAAALVDAEPRVTTSKRLTESGDLLMDVACEGRSCQVVWFAEDDYGVYVAGPDVLPEHAVLTLQGSTIEEAVAVVLSMLGLRFPPVAWSRRYWGVVFSELFCAGSVAEYDSADQDAFQGALVGHVEDALEGWLQFLPLYSTFGERASKDAVRALTVAVAASKRVVKALDERQEAYQAGRRDGADLFRHWVLANIHLNDAAKHALRGADPGAIVSAIVDHAEPDDDE